MKRLTLTLVAFSLLGGLMAGCNGGSPSSGATRTAESVQKQIDAINNNPNMPQSAKDAALSGLQQAKAQSETAAQQSAAQAEAQKSAAKR